MKQSKSEFYSGQEYDAQYAHLYDAEVGYLSQLIEQHQLKTLLDVCCGTGIVTLPLAAKLRHTVGIDFAAPMLAWAKQKAQGMESVQFDQQDATEFELASQFDLVIMTGNAFQAFITDEDALALLANLRRHMHKGSQLVFDTRLLTPASMAEVPTFSPMGSYTSAQGQKVEVLARRAPCPTQKDTLIYEFARHYEDARVYESRIELRFRTLEQVRSLVQKCQFKWIEGFEDWQGTPLKPDSANLIARFEAI